MKNLFTKTLSLTLATAIGVSTTYSPKSSAAWLVECNVINDDPLCDIGYAVGGTFLFLTVIGIVLLPVLFLDQDASGTMPDGTTANYLQDNGYSSSEVSAILQGQTQLQNALKDKQPQDIEALGLSKVSNRSELAHALRTVVPDMNIEYIDFVADYKAIH